MPYVRAMDSFFDGDAKGKKVSTAAAANLIINDTRRFLLNLSFDIRISVDIHLSVDIEILNAKSQTQK